MTTVLSTKMGQWKRIRVFVVGDAEAGKSSVVRWLKGDRFVETHNQTDGAAIETIDLKDWKVMEYDHTSVFDLNRLKRQAAQANFNSDISDISQENTSLVLTITQEKRTSVPSTNSNVTKNEASEEVVTHFIEQRLKQRPPETTSNGITLHLWDCGGQEVYYNTHHFFFTSMAIYLLVVDISKDDFETKGVGRVEFWIRTIRSYAPQVLTYPMIGISVLTYYDRNQEHQHRYESSPLTSIRYQLKQLIEEWRHFTSHSVV